MKEEEVEEENATEREKTKKKKKEKKKKKQKKKEWTQNGPHLAELRLRRQAGAVGCLHRPACPQRLVRQLLIGRVVHRRG